MRGSKDSRPSHPTAENDRKDISRSAQRPCSPWSELGPQQATAEKSGQRDETVNILSARHKKTDDLIENLQRALREQAASGEPEPRPASPYSRLSGARASRIERRNAPVRRTPQKLVRTGKKDERVQIARRLSDLERLVPLSESLGIEMAAVAKNIADAKAALGTQRTLKGRRATSTATRLANEAIARSMPSLMRETEASIVQLERASVDTDHLRLLVERSRTARKYKDYAGALQSLTEARKSIRDAGNEAVLRIIADAKDKFVMAKKAGLKIDDAVDLLNKSRDCLRQGEFEEAVRCAAEGRKMVEASIAQGKESRLTLSECIRAVKLAEALGADVQGLNETLAEAKDLFKRNDLTSFAECSQRLLDLARSAAYGRAAESYALAEKSLAMARSAGVDVAEPEEKLRRSKELLDSDELARSLSMACSSLFESNAALMTAMDERMNGVDEFAKGIEREVDSLSEVREAIDSSKERNLENLRKYVKLSEEIIGDAYESAAAYTCVAQDIVRQAYQSSVQINPFRDPDGKEAGKLELPSGIASTDELRTEDKRQRLIDLYLSGRVSESQLDKLLLMIDSGVAKDKLV